MQNMAHNIFDQGDLTVPAQKNTEEIYPDHTPALSDQAQQIVRQAAGVITQSSGAGVRGDKGLPGKLRHIANPAVGKMGNINNDSQLIHTPNDIFPKRLEPKPHSRRFA